MVVIAKKGRKNGRKVVIFVLFCTVLGLYRTRLALYIGSSSEMASFAQPAAAASSSILQEQIRLQSEFQNLIYQNQHPSDCSKRRTLLTYERTDPLDGFAWILQDLGRHLQASLSTDRTFIMRDSYPHPYRPPNCAWSSSSRAVSLANVTTTTTTTTTSDWNCLFEPISNCTEQATNWKEGLAQNEQTSANKNLKASLGILTEHGDHEKHEWSHGGSRYFNTKYYGSNRIAVADKNVDWLAHYPKVHVDNVPNWERLMGRFWIRAQMAHYLWKPYQGLHDEISKRLPKTLFLSSRQQQPPPFIGMHIRHTDHVKTFRDDFWRDANVTRSLSHFIEIAQEIRNRTGCSTIYLATDAAFILKQLQTLIASSTEVTNDWTFHVQENVPRSDSDKWMWFKDHRASSAPAIATDVEVLRRADYLIGSFHSNVYRLVTELNTAYHVAKYPLHENRHYSVDVEWYESP